VKRYVREAGSDLVRGWLASGTSATSRLSEVEIASALMRRWREGAFDARGRDRALQALSRDFGALSVVEIGRRSRHARACSSAIRFEQGRASSRRACCSRYRPGLSRSRRSTTAEPGRPSRGPPASVCQPF
jgi:hypothetical protein